MGIGLPNASYFPFDTLEASTALPQRFKPTPEDEESYGLTGLNVNGNGTSSTTLKDKSPPSSRLLIPKSSPTSDALRRIDLTTALQYGTAAGYPPLASFLRTFTRDLLHPSCPYAGGPEIILSCGATDGFAKTVECLSDPWWDGRDVGERSGILVEEFCYMNAVQAARPRGIQVVAVGMDEDGMRPGELEEVLEGWDAGRGRRPHLMYTVTWV